MGYTLRVPWQVVLLDEVVDWYEDLTSAVPDTAALVAAAIDLLEEHGPVLGRPLVDTVTGSSVVNLKELRPGSRGRSEIRILFAFDPSRQAVLLMAGDKSGSWSDWYRQAIPVAEDRFRRWLSGDYTEER